MLLNGVMAFPGCVGGCLALVPMRLGAFLTPIKIRNDTNTPLLVTPIGAIGTDGRRSSLPVYRDLKATHSAWQRSRFSVSPGETIEVIYDWDDINFSEVLVERDDHLLGRVVVDRQPEANQYRRASPEVIAISDLNVLEPIPEPSLAALRESQDFWVRYHRIATYAVPVFLLPFVWRSHKKAEREYRTAKLSAV